MLKAIVALAALVASASAHYTFPSLVVNGQTTPAWVNVRKTNNFNTQAPVTDVTSLDLRCYDTQTNPTAETITVSAGSPLGIMSDGTIYHPGVVNVYMAKAPGDVDSFAGDGQVWFKVYQISAVTNGGQSITFPRRGRPPASPSPSRKNLPQRPVPRPHGGHRAPTSRRATAGAQFYISCGQVNVVNGGSGTPGPLVSIPGVYTGYEPGILININYPIPKNYTQPGPPVWSG